MPENEAGALVYGVVTAREGDDLLLDVEGRRARLVATHANPRDDAGAGVTLACTVLAADPSHADELRVSRTQPALAEALLRRHIPAIRSGKTRVVRVARVAGYKSCALVAAVDADEDPVHAATRNRPALKQVLKDLGAEGLDVAQHSDDVARVVLDRFDRLDVLGIVVDEPNGRIEVAVPRGAPAAVFGPNVAHELSLASSLTSFGVEFRER